MTTPTVLVPTWHEGLFVLSGDTREHELRNQSVRGLTLDRRGLVLAIVNGVLIA
jgi:hypothetical protein